ncbi:MAG TPA: T9SS type A sorting domain-containing protein, partial [Puia sp.]
DSYGQTSNATVTVSVMSDLRTAGSAVLLYPNPAQSTINLQLTSDSTGTMSVNIYDMLGNLVQSKQTEKSQSYYNAPFDVSRLAGGVYTMQIVIGTNKPMTAKFIKQ